MQLLNREAAIKCIHDSDALQSVCMDLIPLQYHVLLFWDIHLVPERTPAGLPVINYPTAACAWLLIS